ncbi:MAG: T9SS type A sorting domain-containing protein [Draconibacterium sp.]
MEVQEGGQVLLNGSTSYDPDNGPSELSYQWSSLNGGELGDSTKMNAVFSAPYLLADSVFLLTLTVSDGDLYSLPDTLRIKVLHTNLPPVANAGTDLVVLEGGEVVLNGNASFDPEGKFLLYEWASDYLVPDDVNTSDPLFIAGEVQKDTLMFVTLKVSDQELWSEPDTLWITVQNVNKAPEWLSFPPDSAFLGEAYHGTITVSDPDIYDRLTISVSGLPEWLGFSDFGNGTAELFADTIPNINAYTGNWEIGIRISDETVSVDTVFVLHVDIITGIKALRENSFSFYPNPTSRWLTVQFNNQSVKRILRFYNAEGKLVKQQEVIHPKSLIDLNSLNKGAYFLELLENDKRVEVRKLVVN